MNSANSQSRPRVAASAAVLLVCVALAPLLAQDGAVKKDPPSAENLGRAEAVIKNKIFKEEFGRAQQNKDAALALAGRLLAEARETDDDDGLHFMALMQASELATRAGDNDTALEAVTELAKHYKVDTADMKVRVFAQAEKSITDKDQARVLAEAVLGMIDEPLEADNFAAAAKLVTIAQNAAFKSQVLVLVTRAKKAEDEVKEAKAAFDAITPFLEVLKAGQPENKLPEARLKAGKYYTFTKGNYDKGLPLLAQSDDAALKALAQQDLTNPKEKTTQVKLADAWDARGDSAQGLEQRRAQRRALHWYQAAQPALKGLNLLRVEKRVDELVKSLPPDRVTQSVSLGTDAEITTELRKLDGHTGGVQSVAISHDGTLILSGGGGDNTVRLWDAKTGQKKLDLTGHTGSIQSVAISADKRFGLSGSTDNTMRLWDLQKGQEIRKYPGHNDWVRAVYFMPDKKHVISACDDRNVRIFDLNTGNLVKTVGQPNGHTNYVNGMGLTRDGRKALTCGVDSTLRLWDLATGNEVKKMAHPKTVQHCDLSPDGKWAVTSSYDNTVKVWDLDKGQEARTLPHPGMVWHLSITPSGKRVYTANGGGQVQNDGSVQANMNNNQIRVFDIGSGKEVRVLNGHTNYVRCLALSGDGRYLVSGSSDNTIRVWGPK